LVPILVVDDNLSIAEFCRITLTEAGHSVQTAQSTDEALEILERHPIDIIISDVRMPGVSGLDLLRIVSKGPHPPSVILMTGFATVTAAVEALKTGAYDYIEKPFTRERLTSRKFVCRTGSSFGRPRWRAAASSRKGRISACAMATAMGPSSMWRTVQKA